MALEVKRKDRESSQSLVRRFSGRLKRSGILARARKRKFRERKKSKQMKRRALLRRETIKKEYERKKKLGLSVR